MIRLPIEFGATTPYNRKQSDYVLYFLQHITLIVDIRKRSAMHFEKQISRDSGDANSSKGYHGNGFLADS